MYDGGVGSIVLVEADPEARNLWVGPLTEEGHVVLVASLGEALALISEGGIDAVVIDAADPRAGVEELAATIAALPDAPPIVLVSGSPAAPEISARIGAAHFLAKPCDPGELAGAVARLVGYVRPVLVLDDETTGPVRQYG